MDCHIRGLATYQLHAEHRCLENVEIQVLGEELCSLHAIAHWGRNGEKNPEEQDNDAPVTRQWDHRFYRESETDVELRSQVFVVAADWVWDGVNFISSQQSYLAHLRAPHVQFAVCRTKGFRESGSHGKSPPIHSPAASTNRSRLHGAVA
jgi:hypothetical protein